MSFLNTRHYNSKSSMPFFPYRRKIICMIMFHHTSSLSINGSKNGISPKKNRLKFGQQLSLWLKRQKTGTYLVSQGVAYISELYSLLLAALSVASTSDTTALSMKAIRAAIALPNNFDLHDLTSLPPIQQFQKEKNPAYDFLEIYLTGNLDSYRTFNKSQPTWLADNRTSPPCAAQANPQTSTPLKQNVKSVS